jgi:hypothetical protein
MGGQVLADACKPLLVYTMFTNFACLSDTAHTDSGIFFTQRYFLQKIRNFVDAHFRSWEMAPEASVAKQRGSHIQHTTALRPAGPNPI